MAPIRVLLGLASTWCIGWAAARFFTDSFGRKERAAWGLATGLLAQSAFLLLFLAVRVRPDLASFLLADAAVVGVSLLLRRPALNVGKRVPARARRERLVPALLGGTAVGAWGIFCVLALSEPMWSTDYLAIWGMKGKTIYLTESLPGRLFHDPALAWANPEYPLLVSLSLAVLAFFSGTWDGQALALLFPVCELATLAVLWAFLSRRVSAVAGGVAAALASLCFFLYQAANAGTAEVPLALGVVLASSAVLDFLDADSGPVRARLAIAALFCASLKQEGALFVLLLSGLVFIRSWRARRGTGLIGALMLSGPPLLHSGLLFLLRGPQAGRAFDRTLFEPRRWLELAARFRLVIQEILGVEARQAFVALAAIVLFLLLTKRGIADPLLPVFSAQMLVYALAFSVSAFDPLWAIDAALSRLTLTLFPAFALVLAARLQKFERVGVLRNRVVSA